LATALAVKSVPSLFIVYRGNMIDTMTGVDEKKLNDLIDTALLVEAAQHDESIMTKVL